MKIKKHAPLICLLLLLVASIAIYLFRDSGKITISDIDMSGIQTVKDKKERFFSFLRPIVVAENNRVLSQREKIVTAADNKNLSYIRSMLSTYKLSGKDSVERLLKRVDVLPLELVLTQSANESMWGQSRFAQEGNNLFGQWTYKKGSGLVPSQRTDGATHEVAVFDSVNDSVRSYLMNINTHQAYKELRNIRKTLRDNDDQLTGMALADGLVRYSERGHDYVNEIKAMMKANKTLMAGNPSAAATH